MKITDLAKEINNYCENFDYFWAIGLVKETFDLWNNKENYKLLNDTAKTFVDRYIGIGIQATSNQLEKVAKPWKAFANEYKVTHR